MYIKRSGAFIDVTKAPYNCDNTGVQDCTEALCRAMDDILTENIYGIDRALQKLNESDDPNYRISFEICKRNGIPNVIFPEDLEATKILYFPKGTYLISDTVSHSLENLKNILGGNRTMEINRQIYFMGESREETIIKLKDYCPGFGFGNEKPMISYIRTEISNIAQSNSFQNMTIDCGIGNSGAIGLRFYANNSGSVRNVTILSSDPENRGFCGLALDRAFGEGYIKDVSVTGFDYGIRIENNTAPIVCEKINIKNQKVNGIYVSNGNASVIDLESHNKVIAFRSKGFSSLVALIHAKCTGGDQYQRAVVIASGEAYLRDIDTEGYRQPLVVGAQWIKTGAHISEYSTAKRTYNLFPCDKLSLGLEIQYAPEEYMPQNEDNTVFVDDFGAIGDGITDSTEAIQKALDSGKPYIYFGTGHYLVNGTVTVPETVKTIDFMFCDFYAGENLIQGNTNSFLKIVGDDDKHLTLKNVFSWEKFYGKFLFINHAGTRTLVLKDLHTQCAGMYFNSVEGGKVFIENCACTMGGGEYCAIPPFTFTGQKVWCRQMNPERGYVQILNDHSDLWIYGMKTESFGSYGGSIAVKNINGSRAEVFGTCPNIGGKDVPLFINENSDLSAFFMSGGINDNTTWNILVRETQGNETKELRFEDAQEMSWFVCRVPGYVGLGKN